MFTVGLKHVPSLWIFGRPYKRVARVRRALISNDFPREKDLLIDSLTLCSILAVKSLFSLSVVHLLRNSSNNNNIYAVDGINIKTTDEVRYSHFQKSVHIPCAHPVHTWRRSRLQFLRSRPSLIAYAFLVHWGSI